MGLNDRAWEKIFRDYCVLDQICKEGYFRISSQTIDQYRESRLMAKFDHYLNLPEVFRKNGLSILPITRGEYCISRYDLYEKLDKSQFSGRKKTIKLPTYIQSFSSNGITSEAVAINCAYDCGVFNDFVGDEDMLPTTTGRMSSGDFSFCMHVGEGKQTVQIHNAQMEIDAAYEGARYLTIVEAKNEIPDDFLVRQLYYPYRSLKNKVSKPIKPVFFLFSNGDFYLYEYRFRDDNDYNSIELVKQDSYSLLGDNVITAEKVEAIRRAVAICKEPDVAFPQADNFSRVINLVELLDERHSMKRDDITENYSFDQRQTNYYSDAGRYLGWIQKKKIGRDVFYTLTDSGEHLMKLSLSARQIEIISAVLSHQVFNDVCSLWQKTGAIPSKATVAKIMEKYHIQGVGAGYTYYRRASTVISWINWINGLISQE